VPVEAMACGKPVIAFKAGGALETVVDGVTGLFFDQQTGDYLIEAVQQFESVESTFDNHRIAEHARTFDKEIFKQKISDFVQEKMNCLVAHD